MKKAVFIIGIIVVLTTCNPVLAGQSSKVKASGCAVDNIINYYESMAKLDSMGDNSDYAKKMLFFKENRDLMISKVAKMNASYDLMDAHQVLENHYKKNNQHLGYTPALKSSVIGPAYFDAKTGHRYIRQDANSYAEYTRKGKFIKMVPASLTLLNQSLSVYPITAESYIMYEKYADGKMQYQSLPGDAEHPKGWKARKLIEHQRENKGYFNFFFETYHPCPI